MKSQKHRRKSSNQFSIRAEVAESSQRIIGLPYDTSWTKKGKKERNPTKSITAATVSKT